MRNIIESILRIEREQKRRYDNNALARYNTDKVHLKQMEFHRCAKRNRWVFGGNRTGKTECGAVETVWLARGIHPYRQNKRTDGWVVSLSRRVQREVAQKKILHYLNPDWIADIVMESGKSQNPSGGVIDYISVKNVFGTISTIGFKTCEAGRDKFAGASLDYVWFDEEPPEDIYDECAMRVVDKKGLLFGTMTPLLGLTFVYKRIYLNSQNDPEVWHIFMEWADNPYLDEKEVERVSAAMTDAERDVRRFGRFVDAKGAVYTEFDERVHVIPSTTHISADWQDRLSIDPGLNNPLSCHWYAVDYDGNVYVVAEHFEAGRSVDYHARAIKQKSKELGWRTDREGRIEALIDSAASQHTLNADKSVAELFCDNGILVDTRVDKDLFSGINRVKQYLMTDGKPRIFIFDSCVNLIRELKSYRWGNGDRPVKTDDHCLDELRYYLMSRPIPPRRDEVKTEIQLDKERLIRRKGRVKNRGM
ncbi:MAG: terminase family protein [Clostridiales bacterium]|nr:terminase family protein [Clostridiales bacterium]